MDYVSSVAYPAPFLVGVGVARLGRSSITWTCGLFEASSGAMDHSLNGTSLHTTFALRTEVLSKRRSMCPVFICVWPYRSLQLSCAPADVSFHLADELIRIYYRANSFSEQTSKTPRKLIHLVYVPVSLWTHIRDVRPAILSKNDIDYSANLSRTRRNRRTSAT